MRELPIVVVGAGVTGLSAAHALLRGGADVVLLEASTRCGGNVRTVRRSGCVLDEGPDAWIASKPAATELAHALGLGPRIVETDPAHRTTFVADERGLVPLPDGMMLGIPTRLLPMVRTPLLSFRGKLRAALDVVLPEGFGRGADDDESIGAFVARRLGDEVRDRIAEPLLGGIFHGDVDRLSLRATFPQLAALEAHGGLIRGSRALARRARGKSPFLSLRGGLDELTTALRTRLGDRIRCGVGVQRIDRLGEGLVVHTDRGSIVAREVIVATPAHASARIVASLDAQLAHELAEIRHASSTTVFLGFSRRLLPPLDGTGYLVPARLGRAAASSTWVTSKWRERAPDDVAVLRVFFRTCAPRDEEAIALAHDELRTALGIVAPSTFQHVARFPNATPVPEVGHLARIGRIRARLAAIPRVHLAGNGFDGFGISDCIRQGERLAREILARVLQVKPQGRAESVDGPWYE